MTKFTQRLHGLWESHELHMEVGVLVLSLVLLSLLVVLPARIGSPTDGALSKSVEEGFPSLVTTEAVPHSPVPATGSFVTRKDEDALRASVMQEITKVTQEISALQKASLSVTEIIQKQCGGQTNTCAQELQTSLAKSAEDYDKAQARLRMLTASLGSLK